jgi:predicted transcriptional regulator
LKTVANDKPQSLLTGERAGQHSRRTKYDIWSDILESCVKKQRTRFWLTSRLGLSWKVVDESLRFLTTAKLIEATKLQRKETTKYKTTAKGQEALITYRRLLIEYYAQ